MMMGFIVYFRLSSFFCNFTPQIRYICSAQYENMDNSRIALRFLGIPILMRMIGILKTHSTVLELPVRVLGIGTIWEFLKCAVTFGPFWNF